MLLWFFFFFFSLLANSHGILLPLKDLGRNTCPVLKFSVPTSWLLCEVGPALPCFGAHGKFQHRSPTFEQLCLSTSQLPLNTRPLPGSPPEKPSLEAGVVTPEGWGGKAPTLWLVPEDPHTSFQVQALPGEAQGGHLAGPGTHLILAQGVRVLTGAGSPMEIPQLSGFMCVSGVMLKVCKAQ